MKQMNAAVEYRKYMKITDEKVVGYIDGLYRAPNPFLSDLREEAEAVGIPILQRDTETLIKSLIKIKKPQRILEIGTAVGYSAICMALAQESARVTTLELRETLAEQAALNVRKAGLSHRIRIHQGDARITLSSLAENPEEEGSPFLFDFVFLDGAKGHYLEIFQLFRKLLAPGAVVVSDNILFKAMTAADEYLDIRRNKTIVNRMRNYLAHITSLPEVTTAVLPVGDGVAISVIGEEG